MLGMFRYKIALPMGLLVLCVIQNSFAAESSSQRLVSSELLKHANLKILWVNKLPIIKDESLERLHILGNRVYAISNQNYMVSLNRANGNMIFGRTVAPAGLPIAGLKLYGDKLISITGSKIFEIDPESGLEQRAMDVGFSIACPADRNSTFFYVSGIDRRLHIFRAKDKVQIFEVSADNGSMITSVIADETFVVFATEAGNVISIAPNRPTRLWQFDAADAIAGTIIRDGMSLYFASKNTNVYRIDIVGLPERRRLVWKYQTDGILEQTPRVTQGIVYQYVRRKGLTAIDKENGSFLWSVPGGAELLAEYKGKAYVITENNKLVVMDNVKAKRLYSVNFSGVTKHAANIIDGKIYIADKYGQIACLQPVE